VLAALLVLTSFLPMQRIRAWVWHWRHGNSIQVGEFRIPVPNEWMVLRRGAIMLVNTKGEPGRTFSSTVTITEERQRNGVLEDVASSQRRVMEDVGIHVPDARHLIIDGVTGLCLDGETAKMGIKERHIYCRVGPTLSLHYVGSSLRAPAFYSILDGISKVAQ